MTTTTRTQFPFQTKHAAAASIIELNTSNLSADALKYLAFAFDLAHGAHIDAKGETFNERIESATAIFMTRLVNLDGKIGSKTRATAAAAEIHARPNLAQADGRGLNTMHRGYYAIQIAGRMIFRAAQIR